MGTHESFESLTGRWRATRKRSVSIRTLVTAVVVAIFFVSAAALTFYVAWLNQSSRTDEAYLRARATAAILAQLYADAAQTHGYGFQDLGGIKVILENWFSAGSADKDLAWAFVRDDQGKVVVGQLRAHLVKPPSLDASDAELRAWFFAEDTHPDQGFIKHVVNLERDQDGQRARYAEIKIGYSLARIRADFFRQLLISALLGLVGVVLLSLALLWFLRRLVLNPLKDLAESMDEVRRGHLDARAPVRRNDEIGALADTFNYMVVGLAEREQLADAFQRYVSKQILDKIMETGEQLQLRGETRKVTVLFSDIRGFTSMSEKLLPEQVVSGLNEYFTDMVDVVFRHDGFINKFVGDAMMAVWGAPFDQDHQELRAVRTAVEMIDALVDLNRRRGERGEQPLAIGVGIGTGFAVSGNLGHVERMEYTVIGDAVNVAQRIESQTKKVGHTVLVSEATYHAVAEHVVAEELPTMVVKGKQEPLKLFAIKALREESTLTYATEPPLDERTEPLQQSPMAEQTLPAVDLTPVLPEVSMPGGAPAVVAEPDPLLPEAPLPGAAILPAAPAVGDGISLASQELTTPHSSIPDEAFPEVTLPGSAPELVQATAIENAAVLPPDVQPSVPDEVTLQPNAEVRPAEYLDPEGKQDASDGGFGDPVTSKLMEAEFFKRPPKEDE